MVAMILAHPARWAYFAAVAAIASLLGGIVGYLIGAALFAGVGEFVISFYHLEPWVGRVHELFSGNVFTTMAVVTFTPVPDKIFVFLAGFLHISFPIYLAGYLIGRTARIFIAAWLLKRFGAHVLALAERYAVWVGAAVMIAIVVVLLEALDVIAIPMPF
jgi:membrane protein YqaA with SNARE-associated domain